MLTKTKNQNKTEYLAFRLSSLLAFTGKTQPQDDDFSWINVFTKKDKEQFKNELYDAISKAIQANNWIIVEDLIDSLLEFSRLVIEKMYTKKLEDNSSEMDRNC